MKIVYVYAYCTKYNKETDKRATNEKEQKEPTNIDIRIHTFIIFRA